MDKITKFLWKINQKERLILMQLISQIIWTNLSGLDLKQLKWEKDLFRIRKGKFRIIFRKDWERNTIINIDYRGNIY